ncbi:MAG: class I SAM-dependent rRNA methyltransferase, partial [Ignavibacteria bacterium]|nr:class I SAM-dependent rRNA methyltransferase [Ignavibacteria bacterium]
IVNVCEHSGTSLGNGFYNKSSLIAVRLFEKSFDNDFAAYCKNMISNAFNLRKDLYPNRSSYRLIFSESDFMPGLIIDKYNDTYVIQVYCYGMEKNIDNVVSVLINDLGAKNIFTSNESYFRKLEGLAEEDKLYAGKIGREHINDGSIEYKINFSESQKTGFYFDQSDNRDFTEKIVNGKTVLDAFCNSGGFGLHAAKAGASWITFVDSSTTEADNAAKNFELNELTTESEFLVSDIFVFFQRCIDASRTFDVVMIDPPAFAKSRKSIPTALKGYIKLNKMALSLVAKNGFLVTSSCSYHISAEDFLSSVTSAAQKASRQIQLLHFGGASLDHPRLPAMPETTYLKFAVFRVN